MSFHERTPRRGYTRDPDHPQLNRVARSVFRSAPAPLRAVREAAPFNAPTQPSDPFSSPFDTRKRLRIRSKQPRSPCLTRRSECSFWNPVREFGGTENHPAPNHPKLGQLRYARQGLVCVSESNTKYGGKGRKPRGEAAPRSIASISESSGIPKRKKFVPGCGWRLPPAVHRAGIFCSPGPSGHCTAETHVALRDVPAGMPLTPWYHASISGKVAPIPPSIAVS
jgi:hypothetical protein